MAIENGNRKLSAVKDCSLLMNQSGRTLQAIQLLEKYAYLFQSEPDKLENILSHLQKKLKKGKEDSNTFLKIQTSNPNDKLGDPRSMFQDSSRILKISYAYENNCRIALLKFYTRSAARKTMQSLNRSLPVTVQFLKEPHKVSNAQRTAFPTKLFSTQAGAIDSGAPVTKEDPLDKDYVSGLIGSDLWGDIMGANSPIKSYSQSRTATKISQWRL